ncbi:2-dehydro-3-deoxygalactonokinase [Sphingomonas sp. ST-64]|uniref:2-dehydro-3-deoxygalactonokinase n=1 Tax=Sphingomonas plantiphila TaxID=3163295 RepID=A0ABW8YNH3_9SPHN
MIRGDGLGMQSEPPMSWRDGYIAVDWGSTNRRAYSLDSEGRVVAKLEDAKGVLSVEPGGFDRAADEIRAALGDHAMLIAGMAGSNRGWREAPYVGCPADAEALARAICWVEPGRIGIVPGVCQRDPVADVMRGEEVQALGAVAAELVPPDGLICLPGTHAKWIAMRGGRIDTFRTMMTGELFAVLRDHSILSAHLGNAVTADDAFAAGVTDALGGADLLASLFGIRARHLLGGGRDDASYASGLLIGSDVRAALKDLAPGATVALVGAPALSALYAAALGQAGRVGEVIDGEAAFLAGIRRITELL